MAKNKEEAVPDSDSEVKPSKKWPILVLAVVLSLSALVGGVVMSVGTDTALGLVMGGEEPMDEEGHEDTDMAEAENAAEEGQETASADLVVAPLKEIIVNITSITETGRKSSRFLKLNLALVYDDNIEGADNVTDREVYIRDAFQNYLRQLTERDLSGSIGVIRLKSELLRRARAVTESDATQEVLIADIIVQ